MGQKVTLDLDVVTKEDFQRLAQHVGAACTNVADHEREVTLLRASVQNIQQWIAERAIEKYAAQKNAPPPNTGPAVVEQAEFSRLAMRVAALEGRAAAARVNEAGRSRRLDLLEECLDELAARIAKLDLQQAAPPPPAAPVEEGADDAPPSPGPAVARACPKGTTGVWLGLTTRQAEVLRIILGSIGGEHWSRDHTISPAHRALASVQGPMGEIPGLGEKPGMVWNYWSGHYAPARDEEASDA